MQLQTFNLKTVFIGFLWFIVSICALFSLYYITYIQTFGYPDSKLWIDAIFYCLISFIALFVVGGFSSKEEQKRFYKKQLEILNLFENQNECLVSLNQILSKTSFSEIETKGILEHLVKKKLLIPSFSEERKLIYKLTDNDSLDKYLKKIH